MFSSLFAGGSGFLILLEIVLDDSGNLIADEELTVDVVPIVLWGLLSEVDTVFSEVLEATGLLNELVEFTELDKLAELVKLAELDIDTAELCTVGDDGGVSEDVFSEITGSFVDVC